MVSIMYVLGSLGAGGAERRSLQLFQELSTSHRDARIFVFDMSGGPGVLDDAFAAAGCTILRGSRDLRGLRRFWSECRRHRIDVLHSNVGAISGYFVLAGVLAGIRTRLCHFRSTYDQRQGAGPKVRGWIGTALINLLASRVVGVCESARSFAAVRPGKWMTLYNGVPLGDAATPSCPVIGSSAKDVLVLGRIAPVKNYRRAVSIFEKLAGRSGSRFRLHFVGSGADEDEKCLAEIVAASPTRTGISVHGYTPDPVSCLRAADVLLLPSLWEGLPGSVLEALSVGTPVVASDLPGIREIADKVAGVTLVPLAAEDQDWATAIDAASTQDRDEIAASFARGPFCFDAYVENMSRLWRLTQ